MSTRFKPDTLNSQVPNLNSTAMPLTDLAGTQPCVRNIRRVRNATAHLRTGAMAASQRGPFRTELSQVQNLKNVRIALILIANPSHRFQPPSTVHVPQELNSIVFETIHRGQCPSMRQTRSGTIRGSWRSSYRPAFGSRWRIGSPLPATSTKRHGAATAAI